MAIPGRRQHDIHHRRLSRDGLLYLRRLRGSGRARGHELRRCRWPSRRRPRSRRRRPLRCWRSCPLGRRRRRRWRRRLLSSLALLVALWATLVKQLPPFADAKHIVCSLSDDNVRVMRAQSLGSILRSFGGIRDRRLVRLRVVGVQRCARSYSRHDTTPGGAARWQGRGRRGRGWRCWQGGHDKWRLGLLVVLYCEPGVHTRGAARWHGL
mmetsp:Transcript_48736/g.137151  ORF Transcript_48736/g.137151 Transcript_48736/m.137151 type:complete len:210 (+) Transcript_48736:167-796(+)